MKITKKAIDIVHPRSLKYLSGQLQALVRGRLWLKVLIAMFAGVTAGVLLGPGVGWVPSSVSSPLSDWVALPGKIFLALVQMVVVPLVFASIIRGIAASENLEYLKRTGALAVLFFVATTTVAIVIGIALAMALRPGATITPDQLKAVIEEGSEQVSINAGAPTSNELDLEQLPEVLVGLLPTNPLDAMVNLQMLQVVLFALIMGVAVVNMNAKQSLPLLELLGAIQEVCMTVVRWAMLLAPVAVFGLMINIASKIGFAALAGMAAYVGSVLLGLLILYCLYLVLYAVLLRRSPLEFLRAIRELQLLAFSTSSSAAVMPLSIRTLEDKLKVRPSISQFVVPLGATINMNGTALYQGVATIFLAQVFGIELGLGALSLLVVTAVASSIGSPATPGVGIVILSMVLTTVGIPASGIALIIGVDRILDMSRTAVNVAGDILAAVVLDHYVGGEMTAAEQEQRDHSIEAQRLGDATDILLE